MSTHAAFKKLVSKGMSDDLAEAMTEIMEEKQDGLVTKSDLKFGYSFYIAVKREAEPSPSNNRSILPLDPPSINGFGQD